MKFSSTSNTSVHGCLYPLFQNQSSRFLKLHLFRRMSEPSSENQLKRQTNILSISTLVLQNWIQGVYLSRKFLEFFLKPVYPTMIAEKFQIYCAKITGKHICELKILNLFILTHAPKQNSPLGFYYHYSKQMEMTHFYRLTFFENLFYPSRKGKGIWSWKKWPKWNLWGYLSQVLNVPPFLQPLHFWFLFCCGICWFKHAEMWRFFNLTSLIFTKK